MLIAQSVVDETAARWKPFLANVVETHALGRALVAECHPLAGKGGVQERLSLFFLARATLSLNAVELLFSAGLALDAMAALRTLVELVIDFNFLWKADTEHRVRLYVEYVHVMNHRKLEAQERYFGASDPARDDAAFTEIAEHAPTGIVDAVQMRALIHAEYLRVKPAYPKAASWHAKNTRDRACEVQMDALYDLVHRRGSEASHSCPSAMSQLFEISGSTMRVKCEPEVPGELLPLAMAALIYHALASVVCERLGCERVEEIEVLHQGLNSEIASYYAGR